MDILIGNEIAYAGRYGISLKKCWDVIDDREKEGIIERIKKYRNRELPCREVFSKDSLLRIVIGYPESRILELIIRDALPAVRVIIWEPNSALFLAGMAFDDISSFINDERITLIFGNDVNRLKEGILNNLFEHNVNHIAVSEIGEHPDERMIIDEFRQILTEIVKEQMFNGNLRKLFDCLPYSNYLYAIHLLNNNSTIDQLLENIPTRDIPVIIVSAGPSLTKNCVELKNAKGKALIVAVTHSMKTLAGAGVIPDMVAFVDPNKLDFMDFDDGKSYYLLCDAYASSHDQKHYNGKIIYFGFTTYEGLFTTQRIRGGINPELGTGSVATDAFSLMIGAGFKTFILVGQDLSYDENGHTHTDNFTEESYCDGTGLFMETEGIHGGIIKTRFDWDRFRKYFEKRIESEPGIQVIDATEGGALIHGTRIMRLRDAISEYCIKYYSVSEWFNKLKKGNKDEKVEIRLWFGAEIEKCVRMLNIIEEALKINKNVCEIISRHEKWDTDISAAAKRYDVLYHIIMEGSEGELIRLYCKAYVQRYLEEAMTVEGDENLLNRMILENELFEALRDNTEELAKYMKELQTDLNEENV